jgi:heptosyltransferase-2
MCMGLMTAGFLIKKLIKNEKFPAKNPINLPFFLFYIITCVSVYHSINYLDSFIGGIFRLSLYGLIVYIVIEEVKDKAHIQKILISAAAGLMLTSANEIWQVISGYDFIRGYEPVINIGLVRATASFKDPNTLGIYLSALAPILFGLALYHFEGFKKTVLMCVCAFVGAGITLTYSRPTLLAVYIALFFFGIARRSKPLIAALLFFTVLSPFIAPQSVKNWAKEVGYNPIRFMCNDDRIAVYLHTFNMIKAHPLIGVGANTYMKNYKFYKKIPEYRGVVTPDTMYAHTIYLHMAAEIGLLGLGIFFWFIFVVFKECAVMYRRLEDDFLRVLTLSLAACLIAFLVNGLTESSLYSSRVAVLFWFIIGFVLALKKFIPPLPPKPKSYFPALNNKKIKNILVVRNDRFGEFLLNIPAFRALKETYPEAKLIVLVNTYVRNIAECVPFIDEIIDISFEKLSLIAKFEFIEYIRKKNIDISIMLNSSQDFNFIFFLSRIPIRVGYDKKGGFLLTHKMEDRKYLGEKHEVDYNLELVELIGARTDDKTLSLEFDSSIVDDLFKHINKKEAKHLIALHPWTSDSIKRWPAWNFYELTKKIVSELDVYVLLIGGKEEQKKSRELFAGLDDKILNLTGRTSLRQLAAILQRCRLLLSGDSGPVHLAGAVTTPVIAIFRNDIPGKCAKRWGPRGERDIVIEKNDICDITIDEVFEKVKEALAK